MRNNFVFGLCLVLSIGLAVSAYAAERVVVCEESYSEG